LRQLGTSLKPYSLATLRWSLRIWFFFASVKIVININGEQREIVEGLSVAQLLEELNIGPGRVVIELNRDIVSREAYGSAILKEGDTLEIVHFVGGG
jgi:sulfur carrier protein